MPKNPSFAEEEFLLDYLNKHIHTKKTEKIKILDVGCGYGRILTFLKDNYKYPTSLTGVDINETAVNYLQSKGIIAFTTDMFQKTNDKYDIILMFHIIEHFLPNDLLSFIDLYLERLNETGHLIIATPLFHPGFYDDFDHVKPYQVQAINAIFVNKKSQVQYHSKHNLKLRHIWYRTAPLSIYKKDRVNYLLNLLFKLSSGRISRYNGWIGVYKKLKNTGRLENL